MLESHPYFYREKQSKKRELRTCIQLSDFIYQVYNTSIFVLPEETRNKKKRSRNKEEKRSDGDGIFQNRIFNAC